MIRMARLDDAPGVADIYNHYIATSIATFEETPVSAEEMQQRIKTVLDQNLPWRVMEGDGLIQGYAYATQWKPRSAYRHTAEITVYLAPDATGKGVGSELYSLLLNDLRERQFRVAIGGIALPNPESVALHEKLGMKKVAHFEQTGFKFGQWIDVAYWQCFLDQAKP